MNNNRLERNRTVARLPRVLPVLLLPTLLLVLLLCGLSQETQAKPTRQQGENLVLNPGFEESSPAHWSNPGSFWFFWWYLWSGEEQHEGDYSVVIGSNLGAFEGRWSSDPFRIDSNQQYIFSGWIRADSLSEGAFLTLAFYESSEPGENPILGACSLQVTGSSEWIQVASGAVAPDGAHYARMHCELHGRGTVWFDDIVVVPEVPPPSLSIVKEDSTDPVFAGEAMVYAITYGNTGEFTATQVVVTETYDANVTFVSADPEPVSPTNNVWEIGTLGPQVNSQIAVTVTVHDHLTDGTTLQNWAKIDCLETDPISTTEITIVRREPTLPAVYPEYAIAVNCSGQHPRVFTVIHHITNTSDYTDVLELKITDDCCPRCYSPDQVQVTPTLRTVKAGQSYTATVYITVTEQYPDCHAVVKVSLQSFPQIYAIFLDIAERAIAHPPTIASGITKTADIFSTVTFNHVVTNASNCTDTITVSPSSSHGWDMEWDSPDPLAPGEPGGIVVSVTVPSVMNGATDTVVITATSGLDPSKRITTVDTIIVKANEVYLPLVLKNYPPLWHQGSLQLLAYSVATCPASPKDIVYAGANGKVYQSTDEGETWGTGEDVNGFVVLGLAVHPSDCQTAYAATWGGGVYKRSGISWTPKNNGLEWCLYSNGAIIIHPNDPNHLYLGSNTRSSSCGVFASTDRANHWTQTLLDDKNVSSLFIAASAPYTIYAGTTEGVFRSTDGGNTWPPLGSGLPQDTEVWAVIETPAGQIYAGTQGKGLYRLVGDQWEPVTITGHTDFIIYGLTYVKDSLYVATRGHGVYRFENNTWQPLNAGLNPLPTIRLMFSTEQRLYIATSSGVWWYLLP